MPSVSRHQGIRLSYGELGDEVERVARGLLAVGIETGDRVGIWSPTCAEWTLLQFACARVGAILVNVNPAYRPNELAYALAPLGRAAARDRAVVQDLRLPGDARRGARRASRARAGRHDRRRAQRAAPMICSWPTMVDLGAGIPASITVARTAKPQLDTDDPINIQYTSGTTGNPKGATLTHHNILNNAQSIGRHARATRDADRVCIPVPLYHCFGMGIGNLGCVASGATMVYPAESFEPLATLEAIAEERCTSIYGVPTMFIAMLEHPRFARVRPVRRCAPGSWPARPARSR